MPGIPPPEARRESVPARGFVPLDEVVRMVPDPEPTTTPPIILLVEALDSAEARTSLFGELDR